MLPYDVTEKYEALVTALEEASYGANCGFVEKVNPLQACFRTQAGGKVIFNCILHLKEWKWKGVSGKQHGVNILIHAQEVIRQRDQALLSSIVSVNYFDISAENTRLLQAFHFDYNPCQRDHALFHMQVTNTCITLSGNEAEALKVEFSIPQNANPKCLRSARVPTCDMTLPSVLLCLAADHIGGSFFTDFLERVRELQVKMPQPLIGKLRRSLGATPENLHSSNWFMHLKR
jgi:hypothetical protein